MTRAVPEPRPGQVLVERRWTGVNDRPTSTSPRAILRRREESREDAPLDAGFESVGVVVRVGPPLEPPELSGEPRAPIGEPAAAARRWAEPVATSTFGGFSEYAVVESKLATRVPAATHAEALALLTSGLTASIALEQAGGVAPMIAAEAVAMRTGGEREERGRRVRKKTVLVTAAAGGTGNPRRSSPQAARGTASSRRAAGRGRLGCSRPWAWTASQDYRADRSGRRCSRVFDRDRLAYESVGMIFPPPPPTLWRRRGGSSSSG